MAPIEDLVFEHLDSTWSPEARTEKGIAAFLNLEVEEVRLAMMLLEQNGRIKAKPRRGALKHGGRTTRHLPPHGAGGHRPSAISSNI